MKEIKNCPHGCPWTHQKTHWHYRNMTPKNKKLSIEVEYIESLLADKAKCPTCGKKLNTTIAVRGRCFECYATANFTPIPKSTHIPPESMQLPPKTMQTASLKEMLIDDVVHDLEALDFNSPEARAVVRLALTSIAKEERHIVREEILKAWPEKKTYKDVEWEKHAERWEMKGFNDGLSTGFAVVNRVLGE